jgi:hypothetical protein
MKISRADSNQRVANENALRVWAEIVPVVIQRMTTFIPDENERNEFIEKCMEELYGLKNQMVAKVYAFFSLSVLTIATYSLVVNQRVRKFEGFFKSIAALLFSSA